MKLDFFNILSYLIIIISVANVLLYLRVLNGQSKAFRYFTINLLLVCIIQIGATVLAKVFHQENLFLSHAYMAVQFALLSLFYSTLLHAKWIKIVCGIVFLLLITQYIFNPSLLFKYNPLGMTITHVLIVFYSVLYFYKSLNKTREFIIVNVAIFLYLLSSTLIFASGNLVLDLNVTEETQFVLINVNRVLTLVFQILIFVEWYKNYRVQQTFVK